MSQRGGRRSNLFHSRIPQVHGGPFNPTYLTTIVDPWYFWKGICHSKAHKPVTLSRNPTFTKV